MYARFVAAAAVLFGATVAGAAWPAHPATEMILGELDEPTLSRVDDTTVFEIGDSHRPILVLASDLRPSQLHRRHGCFVVADGFFLDPARTVFVASEDVGCAICDKGREDIPEWDPVTRRYLDVTKRGSERY
jgi:hypothetical protein